MAADKAFPVDEGTKVTLTCKAGFQLQGDNIVTCTKGTEFEHAGTEPKCGKFLGGSNFEWLSRKTIFREATYLKYIIE